MHRLESLAGQLCWGLRVFPSCLLVTGLELLFYLTTLDHESSMVFDLTSQCEDKEIKFMVGEQLASFRSQGAQTSATAQDSRQTDTQDCQQAALPGFWHLELEA